MLGLPGFAAGVFLWAALYVLSAWLYHRGRVRRDWHRDMLAVGLLAVVTLGFYWPLFFTESWIPKGGGDLASFIYPLYAFAARWLRRGIIPLWNPHLYMGMPFAADNQSGLFYPVNLLFFLLLPELTYEMVELMAVTHVFLAGLFMYLFLRDLPGIRVVNGHPSLQPRRPTGRIAAMAGAVTYMFSDLFVVHPGNLNIIATAAWLPLALLCFRRAMLLGSWRWAVRTGIVLGVAALAGHAQMFLYVGLSLGLYTFYELFVHRRDRLSAGWRRFMMSVVAGAVAVGLAALSLIPAYDMTSYTIRASMSYSDASAFSIPPAGLLSILMPGFFGRGTGPFWGPWPRTEMGYAGVLPLMLATAALVLAWRRSTLVRFWLLLGILGLLTAMGPYAILHGWTYALVPVFRQLRVPARAIFLFDFAVAALAACGLDMLLHPLSRTGRRVVSSLTRILTSIGCGAALFGVPLIGGAILSVRMSVPVDVLSQLATSMGSIIFFLLVFAAGLGGLILRQRSRTHPAVLGILAVSVIVFDLASLGAYVEVEPNDPLAGYRHDEALAFLRSDSSIYRVETTADIHGSWAPDWAMIYEMDDLNGIWNPLRLGAYDVLTWVGIQRADAFYNLYNVRYLITGKATPVPDHFEVVFDEGEQLIYRNPQALPRAFMVYETRLAGSDIGALSLARSPDFDPARQIVLKRSSGAVQLDVARDTATGTASIVGRGPNYVDLEVVTSSEGYLFVGEMWMPGWLAYVDGDRQAVLQADYTFRAVHVPAGTHHVHMVYRPLSWSVGLGVTLTTLVGLLLWTTGSLIRRRHADGRKQHAQPATR